MWTRKKLFLLGFWLVLVLVAYFIGKLFWSWSESAVVQGKVQRVFQPVIAVNPKTGTAEKGLSNVNTIIAANLFGDDQSVSRPVQKRETVDAPETRLKFELQGIFISTSEDETRALIAEKGKTAYSYKREDELPGNAVLADILADRVLLRRAGRLESLSFPENSVAGKRDKAAQQMLTYSQESNTSDLIEANKEKFYENPAEAFGEYGLIMDSETDGLRIDGSAKSKMLVRAGLKKGDLIRSVNGNTLSDFQKDQDLLDSVVESGEITVEIDRDGEPIVLTLPIP